jgi:hypothetical protein
MHEPQQLTQVILLAESTSAGFPSEIHPRFRLRLPFRAAQGFAPMTTPGRLGRSSIIQLSAQVSEASFVFSLSVIASKELGYSTGITDTRKGQETPERDYPFEVLDKSYKCDNRSSCRNHCYRSNLNLILIIASTTFFWSGVVPAAQRHTHMHAERASAPAR